MVMFRVGNNVISYVISYVIFGSAMTSRKHKSYRLEHAQLAIFYFMNFSFSGIIQVVDTLHCYRTDLSDASSHIDASQITAPSPHRHKHTIYSESCT